MRQWIADISAWRPTHIPGTNAAGYVGVNEECVALARAATGAPQTVLWQKDALVQGNTTIKPGTLITTFGANGHYVGHAAVYVSQSGRAITVYDQWDGQPAHERQIQFRGWGSVVNDGTKFHVVQTP